MSEGALVVTLDTIPPSLNHAYKNTTRKTRAGKVYTARRLTDEAQAWRDEATLRIRNAAQHAGWAVGAKTPIAVSIRYTMPGVYTKDLDGLQKVLLDAMQDAIGVDDRRVIDLRARKCLGPEEVSIVVLPLPSM